MKTPDEIKKGLEKCCNARSVCDECEFSNGNAGKWKELMGYALAYIQQLEAGLAEWGDVCASPGGYEDLARENNELSEKIQQLETENHQLKMEREALLTDLRATDPCDNCKHCGTAWECDGDCSFCYHSETCQCRECDNDSHWEWAGIKEDNHE